MKGVILAAGKGTRLRPWTETTPKPLLPLNGKPMMDYVLEGFRSAGVLDVIIVTGYLAEQIENHYGDGSAMGMRFSYMRQEQQLGTGHAVALVRDFTDDGLFLLSWSDVIVEQENYAKLVEFHTRGNFDASITLDQVDDPWEGAAVYMDGDIVRDIIEKPPKGVSTTNYNNRGIFILGPIIYEELAKISSARRGEYDLPDAVRNLIARGLRVGGMPISGHSSDVGTIQAWREFEDFLKSRGSRH